MHGHRAGPGLSSLVVTLDPSTGAELRRLDWPGAIAVSTIVDGDVVLVGSDDDGRVVARRWSPGTGTDVWTYRSEPDVVAPMATRWELGTGWVRVTSRSQVAVDLATGTAVPPDAPGSGAVDRCGARSAQVRSRHGRSAPPMVRTRCA